MPYSHSSVDEQVVKMTFNNSDFDQNINESIKALSNLDSKLGLINKADFSGITNNLDKLANVFTVKGQIMLGVFTRLGNEAVNLGKKIKNSLTQGIRDGLGEYKLIIDSTQTIFQNVKQSGATLENVNDALDELNDYADKTIYNFAEMTRMIGMFTSAGVSLKKSVSTIKGLANAAALVGANSEKAQIAWHAVSRAMSSGVFTNITWKSLELSNIAGKQFNEVITQVARANKVVGKSGKNIDEMIKKYGSLRLTLSEGWLTKDLFAEAMQIMSGDLDEIALKEKGYTETQIKQLTEIANSAEAAATQVKTFQQLIDTTKEAIGSGWAQSFRILIGDLEQAKKMFTRISIVVNDFIDNNAKIRNKLFEQIIDDRGLDNIWKSGRENFQQTIENMMAVVKTFMKSVQTGFLNIFPVERIASAARKVLDVVQKATRMLVINKEQLGEDGELLGWDTEHIYQVSEAIKDLIRFFRGLASAVDIAWMAFSQPLKVIIERIPFLKNFFEDTNGSIIKLLSNLGKFGDKITVVRNAIKNTDLFAEFLRIILDNTEELGEMYPILGAIFNAFKNLKIIISKVKETFDALDIKPLSVLFGAFKLIVNGIGIALNFVFESLKKAKEKINWSFLDGPKNAIIAFTKQLSDYGRGLITFKDITEKIGNKIADIYKKITEVLDKFKINKTYRVVNVDIGDSYGNLDHTVKTTGDNITKTWDKIVGFFQPIKNFFSKIFNGADFTLEGIAKKIALIGGGVAAASISISLLVKTIKKIKIIDNINDLLMAGVDVLKAYQRQMQSKMILNIAISIGILAASMAALAFIPYDKLENGLVIFSTFMAVLATTLTPIITAMAKFNTSLIYTRKQVKELTKLDVLNNLVKELGLFGRQMADGFKMKMIGEMFKDLAISIFVFVAAVSAMVLLFKYDTPNTIKALEALGLVMAALTVSLGLLILEIELLSKKTKTTNTTVDAFSSFFKLSGVARVIIAIAAAVAILVGSLALMTKLDPTRLDKCFLMILTLVGAIGLLATGITALTSFSTNVSKLKKLNISLGGAILGIAACILAMKPLIETIDSSIDENAWVKALVMVSAIIAQFTAMSVVIMSAAKALQVSNLLWARLNAYIITMGLTIGIIGGVTVLMSKIEPIDESIITTLITLTTAFGILASLLTVVAVVASRGQGIFSGGFAITITSISIALASIVMSFGILAAGVAALVAAINAVDTNDVDSKSLSTGLVKKLGMIALTIQAALPQLRKIAYNLGKSVGAIATNFIKGFAESIIDAGETFDDIAEKIVELILNILTKVINILYKRKDDIVMLVKKLIDILAGVVTAIVGSFFKKKDGTAMFTEQQVMGMIGVIGIASAVIKIITVMAKVSKAIKGVSAAAKAGSVANGFFAASLGEILLAIGAVVLAVEAVESAGHQLRKSWGEDTEYINTDIQSISDALEHLFLDKTFTKEVFSIGFEQFGAKFVSGWMSIFETIASGCAWIGEMFIGTAFKIISIPIIATAKMLKQIDPSHNDTYDKIINAATTAANSIENQAKMLYEKGKEDFKFAWDFTDYYIDPNVKTEYYNDTKDIYSNAGQGAIDGWNSKSGELEQDALNTAENFIGTQKDALEEHSPSKLTREVYHNAMLGALEGLDLGKDALEKKTKEITEREVYLFEQGAIKTAEAWKDILEASGLDSSAGDRIRKLSASFYDTRTNKKYEQVELNREMVDLINSQAEALNGMNREQARNYLLDVMRAKGIASDAEAIEQMQLTLEAFYSNSADNAKLHTDQIKKFAEGTMLSVLDVAGKSAAAEELVIKNTYDKYYDVWKLAEENKELLVGKKKEEVEEILKEEAKKAGLTAAEAEDTAKLVAGTMFAGLESEKEITKEGLEAQLKANETEYINYERMQYQKTRLLEKEYDIRNKLAEKQAWIQSKFDAGWTASEYQSWMRSSEGQAYQKLQNQHNSIVNEYKNTVKQQQANIKKLYTDAGMSSENAARRWQADYDKALALVVKGSNQKSGGVIQKIQSVFSGLGKLFNVGAGDVDLSYWNVSDKAKSSVLNDTDTKSAVDAAADLKNDLEAQRADLTPTFDLDQLQADANKANGIVMSSLMAAQNASIADYINKDSELNPFMKDRWQNVYNFTQNNYSPKALSRIDIYRQTERQISMSRGF